MISRLRVVFLKSKGKLYLCVIDQSCSVKMAGVLMDRDKVEREICSRWRFLWDCHQLVGQYPSPTIAVRKETNINTETNVDMKTSMDMETNMKRCLTE